MSHRAAQFHALVRGERRGAAAALARAGLWWLRLPYGAGVAARNLAFDRGWKAAVKLPVPVVSVGNLTLGGTGKTPCVEAVARVYRELGYAVALVSRGYGAERGPNDEALVLEQNLPDVPHFQGADRVAAGMIAVEEAESDLIVLDDGFQHRRLARDLDIVLVDVSQPLSDDYLFPRGTLREPLSSLRRADVVLATHADRAATDPAARGRLADLARRAGGKLFAETAHRPTRLVNSDAAEETLDLVRGRPAFGFCGVGHPAGFRRTLEALGADVRAFRAFPDHHPYTRADVDSLTAEAAKLPPGGLALTTQKDLVKLQVAALGRCPLWAVQIRLAFLTNGAEFAARLRRVVEPDPQVGV